MLMMVVARKRLLKLMMVVVGKRLLKLMMLVVRKRLDVDDGGGRKETVDVDECYINE
jgi:hypothetical protein